MLRIFLELIRILVVFFIIGGIMGGLVKLIYASIGINVDNTNGAWLVGLSILLLIFVLYRNRLQFSGFYRGKEKLPKKVSISLILCSVLLILIAPFFN
ncbi:hypothetical protein [Neobacillus niacini]|uniref:hypothetical protein n=1 Tax=Neobacillus niacini TaxID=86668 RepID=UPI0028640D28|nr:hypothetical protein [Neobacillus niacini]MDR7000184.1 hypothetical protein [Neobacillus niacini]